MSRLVVRRRSLGSVSSRSTAAGRHHTTEQLLLGIKRSLDVTPDLRPEYAALMDVQIYLNREDIENSKECGCLICGSIFPPSEITLWSDLDRTLGDDPGGARPDSPGDKGKTAICPKCECPTVVGSRSGYTISSTSLRELRIYLYRSQSDLTL